MRRNKEQLNILQQRGLIVDNPAKAVRILKSENYYNLINVYKERFLLGEIEDKFKKGTTFEEIYQLYLFDRELRTLLFPCFLKFETRVKSLVAYRFTESSPEPDAYLYSKNFSSDGAKTKSVLTMIPHLYKIIGNEFSKEGEFFFRWSEN